MPRTELTDLEKKNYHDFVRHTLSQLNQEMQTATTSAGIQSWYEKLQQDLNALINELMDNQHSHRATLERTYNTAVDHCRSCVDTKLRLILSTLITHLHLLILSFH